MTFSDDKLEPIVDALVEMYQAMGLPESGPAPDASRARQVVDRQTGLMLAIHQIGRTLNAIGGAGLRLRTY